jgi:hypothetical protein
VVAGETSWDALEARLHERMLASADTFLAVEVGTFERFLPDDKTLAAITVPVRVLVSEHGRRPSHQAAGRLAERLGVDVTSTPGTPHPAPRPPARAGPDHAAVPSPGQRGQGVDATSALMRSAQVLEQRLLDAGDDGAR